jgi:hypothetical protein
MPPSSAKPSASSALLLQHRRHQRWKTLAEIQPTQLTQAAQLVKIARALGTTEWRLTDSTGLRVMPWPIRTET